MVEQNYSLLFTYSTLEKINCKIIKLISKKYNVFKRNRHIFSPVNEELQFVCNPPPPRPPLVYITKIHWDMEDK